jgi:hypothetical protein
MLMLLFPALAAAHCDTVDGPVITTAKAALESGDLTPVLKWVRKGDEPELRAAFGRARAVRSRGPEAKELADTYFFETLVRVHRAGEGAPYTGLKPAGAVPPAIAAADAALVSGSAEGLTKSLIEQIATGIRTRFARAQELKKHANESVEAGRQYVKAYVELMHYLEALSEIDGDAHHAHGGEVASGEAHPH